LRIAVISSLAVTAVMALAACGAGRPTTYIGHSRAATVELVGPQRKRDAQVWDLSLQFTRAGASAREVVARLRNPAIPRADLAVFCLSDRGLAEAGVAASQLRGKTLTVHFVNLHKASRWVCGLRDGQNPKDRVGESRATYIANSIVAATLTRR
jgi:hypothetical protein